MLAALHRPAAPHSSLTWWFTHVCGVRACGAITASGASPVRVPQAAIAPVPQRAGGVGVVRNTLTFERALDGLVARAVSQRGQALRVSGDVLALACRHIDAGLIKPFAVSRTLLELSRLAAVDARIAPAVMIDHRMQRVADAATVLLRAVAAQQRSGAGPVKADARSLASILYSAARLEARAGRRSSSLSSPSAIVSFAPLFSAAVAAAKARGAAAQWNARVMTNLATTCVTNAGSESVSQTAFRDLTVLLLDEVVKRSAAPPWAVDTLEVACFSHLLLAASAGDVLADTCGAHKELGGTVEALASVDNAVQRPLRNHPGIAVIVGALADRAASTVAAARAVAPTDIDSLLTQHQSLASETCQRTRADAEDAAVASRYLASETEAESPVMWGMRVNSNERASVAVVQSVLPTRHGVVADTLNERRYTAASGRRGVVGGGDVATERGADDGLLAAGPAQTLYDARPSQRAPPLTAADLTSISVSLDALVRLGRAGAGESYRLPPSQLRLWQSLAQAVAALDLSSISARDASSLLASYSRAGIRAPPLALAVAERVARFDARDFGGHPRAYASLLAGLAYQGALAHDGAAANLAACLQREFEARRRGSGDSLAASATSTRHGTGENATAAAIADDGRGGLVDAIDNEVGLTLMRPRVTRSVPASQQTSLKQPQPARVPFRLAHFVGIFSALASPDALAALPEAASLMETAAPLLLRALHEAEEELPALRTGSSPRLPPPGWTAAAAELVHAYAVICFGARRLRAHVPAIFEDGDAAVTRILTAYHDSGAAAAAAASRRRPTVESMQETGVGADVPIAEDDVVSLRSARARLHGLRTHRLTTAMDVQLSDVDRITSDDPFHGVIVYRLVTAFARPSMGRWRGGVEGGSTELFAALDRHLTHLLEGSRPLRRHVAPQLTAATLHNFVCTSSVRSARLMNAAAAYFIRVLGSPVAAARLTPAFYATVVETFAAVAPLCEEADANLMRALAYHVCGDHADASQPAVIERAHHRGIAAALPRDARQALIDALVTHERRGGKGNVARSRMLTTLRETLVSPRFLRTLNSDQIQD